MVCGFYHYCNFVVEASIFDYLDLSFSTDLLHTFSYLPRDLNFIDHTSDIGWKAYVIFKKFLHFLGFDCDFSSSSQPVFYFLFP